MTLLDMSISGAVIIMVIVLIRALAINRLPKKTFLFLWGVALCRLLIPFNMPSPFSAYNLIQQGTETSQMQTGNMIALVSPVTPLPIGTPFAEFVENPINIPLLVWFLGAFLLAAYFSITYILFRREFQMALPVKNEYVKNWLAQMKMKRTITIRQSSRISAPLTYGIWKPIILMPKHTNWEDSKQINYVLAHELVHIRRFDTVTKLLLTAVLCIHWFNPLVWAMYILSNRDMELSCDETVVRSFGDTTKSAYALTLISMEESKNRLTPLCNNFSKNAIEERITAIMKMKKTSIAALAAAILLVGGVTTVFATSAKADSDNVSQAYSTETVITQQEQAELDKQQMAERTKQFSVYKDYGLTYEAKTDSLYYNGNLVRWFSDKINAENQYVTFVRDNDGMDLRAVRNNSYKLTGIIEVSQAEYDKHTQSIKATASMGSGAYEQGDTTEDLKEQMKLLEQYGDFGVSFNSNGEMLYDGELVRYFCDGIEMEAGIWATHYQYLNEKGTVDVFTNRTVIDNGDGSINPFGNLIGLKKSSQKEFEQRDLSDFSASANPTSVAEGNTSTTGGMTFAEKFSKYKSYGIEYKEERQGSGNGNVYFNGELVKTFIDETPTGGVFSYSSKDGGNITVQAVYDSKGNLTGVEKK